MFKYQSMNLFNASRLAAGTIRLSGYDKVRFA